MRISAAALVLIFLSPCAAASVHPIAPGLYAYISEDDSSANSTFLITPQGILVVDTGLNAEQGRKLLAEIRKLSSAPVRYIVNTHYHPDHRGGNDVVGPDATVISTEFTLQQNPRDSAAPNGQTRAGFARSLTVYLDAHEVLIFFPGPAHTRGDAVAYFVDLHAVATGDLFLNGSCPAMDRGDLENWVAALDNILKLPVEAVVPGHFELAGKTELTRFRDYLAAVRDQVSRMYSQHKSLAEVQKSLDLGAFKDFRQFPQYQATFGDNAATYYDQLQSRQPH